MPSVKRSRIEPGVCIAVEIACDQPSEAKEQNPRVWGMFAGFRRIGTGAFAIDFDEARMRFTYVVRNGKPYFTHVHID